MSETYGEPQSRNEAILQNILGEHNELVYPQSRNEAILQAILYNTAYTEEARSRIETLLLCILNGTTTDMQPLSRNEEILIAKINGGTYDKEPQSRIEQLLIDWLNAYEEKTVSGAIVSIADAIAGPVIRCVCEANAKQASGTPTPENQLPISGFTGLNITRAGKNIILFPYYSSDGTYSGIAVSTQSDGKITATGKAAGTFTFYLNRYITLYPGTYTLSVRGNHTGARMYVRDFGNAVTIATTEVGTADSTVTFTINEKLENVGIYFNCATGTDVNVSAYVQLEFGSAATAYEPYNGTVYPVTWQTEAGTVYGCLLNPITGMLTVTHGKTTLNDLTIYRTTSYTNPVFYANLAGRKLSSNFGMSDKLKYIGIKANAQAFSSDSVGYDFAFNSRNEQVYIRADNYSDVTQFKTALGSTEIVYELDTPQTYQLQAVDIELKQGINTVYHDGNGDITLTYKGG